MKRQEVDPNQPFSGARVLVAIAIGCAIGALIAYFMKVLIDNTPVQVDITRLRLFYLIIVLCGGLGGFAIETTRQLQQEATDPLYRHRRKSLNRRR